MTAHRLAPRAAAATAPERIPGWTNAFWHNDTPSGAGFHGLALGRDHGYTNADINVNACKAGKVLQLLLGLVGVLINTHWIDTGHDHWRSAKVKGNVKLRTLTWPQVRKLRSPGGFRVRRLTSIIRRAAELGYTHLELELKDGVDWLPHAVLVALIRQIERIAARVGVQIYWKTLSDIGDPLKRVKAVHAAGGITVLLPRDHPHLSADEWWPHLDYFRGDPDSITWTHARKAA